MADVQIGGGLVQNDDFRLLTDGSGQKNPLPLTVADGVKIPVRKLPGMDDFHSLGDLLLIVLREQAQTAGIGVTPGGDNVPAGHQLRLHPLRKHHRHPGSQLLIRKATEALAVNRHGSPDSFQLPGDGFENGTLARAVWADEGHDLAFRDVDRNVPNQRLSVVAHGELTGLKVEIRHVIAPCYAAASCQ